MKLSVNRHICALIPACILILMNGCTAAKHDLNRGPASAVSDRHGYTHLNTQPVSITVRFIPVHGDWKGRQDEWEKHILTYAVTLQPGQRYRNVFELAGISAEQYDKVRTPFHAVSWLVGSCYIQRQINGEPETLWASSHGFDLSSFSFENGDVLTASEVGPY